MKILIFLNSLAGGGTERAAAVLANFWARQQWDVTVLTLASESEDFYRLHPAVTRISLNMSGASKGALDALLQNMRRVRALRRTLRRLRPVVALSMMSTPNVLLAFAAAGIPHLCTIGSEHCYPPHSPLGRLWTGLRKKMYGRLSAVVALTSECAAWIEQHSTASYVPVIPNAAVWPLPANSPNIPPESLCAPERKLVLAVGRLNPVKNFGALVNAFAALADRHPEWDLVILGEGPERRSLEATIEDSSAQARIFLPGIAGNVGEWYARANLFVMTSHSEGFPVALAEALAHGLPAVSVDCNTGPRDIIRQGIDGLLVPPGDRAALMQALERVMGDQDFRERLAARAPDARERFSVEKIAHMWEDLFTELSCPRLLSRQVAGKQA